MPREFTPEALELVAARFRILGEPTRLRLLDALRDGEKSVSELVDELETGQANVSKHLSLLRRHGFVARRRQGLHSFYSIAEPQVFELCEIVCDRMVAEAEARRRLLESSGD